MNECYILCLEKYLGKLNKASKFKPENIKRCDQKGLTLKL